MNAVLSDVAEHEINMYLEEGAEGEPHTKDHAPMMDFGFDLAYQKPSRQQRGRQHRKDRRHRDDF